MDNSYQTFAKVAARFGVKHADKLIFGTVNRVQMSGFVETFNIYEGHPRVVVMVRAKALNKSVYQPLFVQIYYHVVQPFCCSSNGFVVLREFVVHGALDVGI